MRFSSSSSLQFLAAAATEANMFFYRAPVSSRGPSSWRRGYSVRPSDELVSGDSHFRSVGDANYTSRQFEPRFQSPPYRQPPPYHHNQRPPQQQRRQSYRPPDYRHWQYASSQPPPHCERFSVLSYNILADYLAMNHQRELYSHIPRYVLDWGWRKSKILFELGLWSPDIMCMQEVDRFQDLDEELKLHGYSGIWKMRTGIPVDGCAIFWRTTRFMLMHEESIEYNKFGLRDNIAQICVFKSRSPYCSNVQSDALPQRSNGGNQIVICNTHVLYNPRRGEIKLGQVRLLLDRAHAVSKLWNDAPIILCGDFNCTPKSPLYNFISEQKLDLTGHARDQMSGQASAQIYRPRPYTPNTGQPSFRTQTPDMSVQASISGDISVQASISGEGKEVGAEQRESILEMQAHNKPSSTVESSCSTNNMHQSHFAASVVNKSSIDVHCDENIAIFDKSSNVIHNGGVDKESLRCQLSVEVPVDSEKDEAHDLTPAFTPSEDDNSALVTKGHGEQSSGSTDHSLPETGSRHFQSNLHTSGLMSFHIQEGLVHDDMDIGIPSMKENVASLESSLCSTESRPENAVLPKFTSLSVSDASFTEDNKVYFSGSWEESSVQLITGEEKVNTSTSDCSLNEVVTSELSTSVDFDKDQKLFSPSKLREVIVEDESSGQASTSTILPEVEKTAYGFGSGDEHDSKNVRNDSGETNRYMENQVNLPQCNEIQGDPSLSIDSGNVEGKKNMYDPSSWTPMEIETASGSAECTFLEHPLKLKSTYAEIEDLSGTRDSSGEPLVTSYNRRFIGTVDYIWRSEGLQTVKVLDTIPKQALQWTPGFPTKKWGSDHIALVTQVAFTKGMDC